LRIEEYGRAHERDERAHGRISLNDGGQETARG